MKYIRNHIQELVGIVKSGGTPKQQQLALVSLGAFALALPMGFYNFFLTRLPWSNVVVLLGVLIIWPALKLKPPDSSVVKKWAVRLLIPLGLFGLIVGTSQVSSSLKLFSTNMVCHDDVAIATAGGGELFNQGKNPYTDYNFLKARQNCSIPLFAGGTPVRQGSFSNYTLYPDDSLLYKANAEALHNFNQPEFEKNFNYPAGTFLLGALGLGAIIIISLVLYALVLLMMLKIASKELKVLIPFAFLAQFAIFSIISGGRVDCILFGLSALGWLLINSWSGALSIGLAASIKQTVWFLIPAYIIIIWVREGWKVAAQRSLIIFASFAVINLPFIILNPSAYFKGVMGPALDGLFPAGYGLVAFINLHILPLWTLPIVNVLPYVVVALSLVIAWKYEKSRPGAAALVASLALWLGPRSFLEYIAPAGLIMLSIWLQARTPKPINLKRLDQSTSHPASAPRLPAD